MWRPAQRLASSSRAFGSSRARAANAAPRVGPTQGLQTRPRVNPSRNWPGRPLPETPADTGAMAKLMRLAAIAKRSCGKCAIRITPKQNKRTPPASRKGPLSRSSEKPIVATNSPSAVNDRATSPARATGPSGAVRTPSRGRSAGSATRRARGPRGARHPSDLPQQRHGHRGPCVLFLPRPAACQRTRRSPPPARGCRRMGRHPARSRRLQEFTRAGWQSASCCVPRPPASPVRSFRQLASPCRPIFRKSRCRGLSRLLTRQPRWRGAKTTILTPSH